MSKRSVSYGTILGIILTIIVFVIVIIVAKNIFSAANYAGRWECKFAYAIASPFGLFSQESAVVQDAAKWGMAIIATATAVAVGVAVARSFKKITSEGSKLKRVWMAFKDALSSQKLRTFLKVAGATGATLAGIYALASVSNSIAESMQRPILDYLCKPKLEGYVDTNDLDLKKCIEDLEKEVLNATKRDFVNSLDDDKKKVLCLLYPIAKLVIATYGETIGTSVRVGYGRLHYVLLVNYSLEKTIYLSDLLTVLDLIGINENKSYYDLIYSEGIARAKGDGEIYLVYKGIRDLRIDKEAIAKIITLYTLIDENGKVVEKYGDNSDHDNILFKEKGYYMVIFIYDGQGGIIINTIATR